LAEKAHFSPFHFQRIFKSVVGETPKQYIKRLKLEAAAQNIFLKPETSILEIAFNYGFTSLEAFSRAFKNYYTVSPDSFRNSSQEQKIKILNNKTGITMFDKANMFKFRSVISNYNHENLEIEVIKSFPRKLIYLYHSYKDIDMIIESYKKLEAWGRARELINYNAEKLGLLFDFPAFTSHDNTRFYTCITVNRQIEVTGDVGYMELPSRTYAVFKIKIGIDEIIKSVSLFTTRWIPKSGYEICQLPVILVPLGNFDKDHLNDISYQISIPIRPK
jgi:AraC family transcriptional regulator